MKRFPLAKRSKWIDFLLGVFILLILIPQTGQPIRVGIHRLKAMVWAPSVEATEKQLHIPAFEYALQNLEGEQLTQRIGEGRVTFISLWATWCPPCLAELPSIDALYKDYKDRMDFVLVTHESPEVVHTFLNKKKYDLPVYFPASQLPEALQSNSLPTNYLIDAQGNVIIAERGAANWNSKKVRKLLDGLLEKNAFN